MSHFFVSIPPPLLPASIGCPLPPYKENRKTLHFCIDPLFSVNFCDFLTPTDAVTENPQKYLAAEKYYLPNQLGWRKKVLKPLITFMLLSGWCPLGHGKGHLPAREYVIRNRLIPILTPLSSRWTVPLIQMPSDFVNWLTFIRKAKNKNDLTVQMDEMPLMV